MPSRVPKPSKPSETPSAAAMEVIDLTSDTEASPPQAGAAASSVSNGDVETSFPSALKIPEIHTQALYHTNPPIPSKKKKNSKGVRWAADASATAQQSGEVISTAQPSMEERIPSRPAKRRKGPSSSQHGEADKGLKHQFEGPEWSRSHKEKCSLCYCYVCDRHHDNRPAGEYLE